MKYTLNKETFKKECPIVSRIPIVNKIAYSLMAKAYNEQKTENENWKNLIVNVLKSK